jgi:1,4-alpha-glucan branching enzyme
MQKAWVHSMPYGAQIIGPGRAKFRLWAPDRSAVSVEFKEGASRPMEALGSGWFECIAPGEPGTAYRYRLAPPGDEAEDTVVPDPASRQQVDGDIHGYSVVVDPSAYEWTQSSWQGLPWHEAVIYELHVGTLGGFAGVQRALPELAALGISAVELMPIAEFPGTRN